MYSGNAYIFLFFVYGLAFFTMGIAALLQQGTTRSSSFPLQRSIVYLGLFGVIHGFTEWIIMVRISGLVPGFQRHLFALGTFTNGISFVFLWVFGACLLQNSSETIRRRMCQIPWFVFGGWTLAFVAAYAVYGTSQLHWVFLEDIFSRYFIGFPGAVITVYALFRNARELHELKLTRAALKMRGLAVLFASYGFFAGLIVDNKGFFPSNVLNKDAFLHLTGFPVEVGRAASAIAITLLFVNLIRLFEWENERNLKRLTEQQTISQQRSEMGRELHDVIVQHLFVTGLKLEELMEQEDNPRHLQALTDIRQDLNWSMDQIRAFIGHGPEPVIQMEDLRSGLRALLQQFEKSWGIPVSFEDQVPAFTYGALSREKTTHIYYIIQEALWNAFKHSEATRLTIVIRSTMSSFIASVKDNGKGFSPQEVPADSHFGLQHMKERAQEINGVLTISSHSNGTTVMISVPWEESENDE
ncbi:sensor histidine kinase [Anoxynatronum buryatiense]|uniref:histidine kinase n=1 Tax=Anoxynatronum buryatiense TaxID=489973 RepID=A0AA46AJL9_9CLOT|nr:sensor histidine kinase [Anoxynatronum buryatiense]SMP62753.1 Signal transduction histidine kinase [Anoxynatronum buryatiense]